MKFSRESREIERRACHELRNDNYSERQMVNRSSTKKYQTEKIKEKKWSFETSRRSFSEDFTSISKRFLFLLGLISRIF